MKAAYFRAVPSALQFLPPAILTPDSPAPLSRTHWTLLILNHDGCRTLLSHRLPCTCDTLLLPGEQAGAATQLIQARQVISAGLSSRNSITFSSLRSSGALVCVQRTLLRLDGSLLEPQEFLFSGTVLPPEEQLLLFGLQLLLG